MDSEKSNKKEVELKEHEQEIDLIRAALIKAEKSGFTTQTADEIKSEALNKKI